MKLKPDIYDYHDYRAFLRDWFEFLRREESGFSMRSLAIKSELSAAYLPFVVSGSRNLSEKSLRKLQPFLKLAKSELQYLDLLRILSDSDSQSVRMDALKQIQKMKVKALKSVRDLESVRYLSHWYYVAVRELATLENFEPDAKWIAKKMRGRITTGEAEEALDFLKSNGYLKIDSGGKAQVLDKELVAKGGMYRLLLNQFHQEMLHEGMGALQKLPNEERHVLGYTFSFSDEEFPFIKEVLDEAMRNLKERCRKTVRKDRLFHTVLYSFPLSSRPSGGKGGQVD